MKIFLLTIILCASFQTTFANQKEWTILVFMNGDNSLSASGYDDLEEIKKAGFSQDVNIIVQQDSYGSPARRLKTDKAGLSVISEIGEVDMGDYHELIKFTNWGTQTFPAKRYLLVIWNHGMGWTKGISHDDQSGNTITIPELRSAFARIEASIDIVAFDACLMNMMEVAYEIKKFTPIILGSEESEPANGWPYDEILKELYNDPFISSRELSKIVVEKFGKSYTGGTQGKESVTQSALDSSLLEHVIYFVDIISENLLSLLPQYKQHFLKAAIATQSFDLYIYKDFIDFIKRVINFLPEDDKERLREKLNTLNMILGEMIISNFTNSVYYSGAYGISIYLPINKNSYLEHRKKYKELLFTRDSHWDEFLDKLLLK